MRKIALSVVAFAMSIVGSVAGTAVVSADAVQSADQATTTVSTQAEPEATQAADTNTVYAVVSGDTLSGIAEAYNTTYPRLYDANSFIANPDLIYPGDQVTIPGADEQIASRDVPAQTEQAAPAAADPAPVAAVDNTAYAAPATNTDVTAGFDPAELNAPVAQPSDLQVPNGDPAPYSASDQTAKSYIYFHESSFNPDATNYLDCYGLGQDCNNVVRNTCGADWACQDQYFSTYAHQRYGSWQNALAFWENNHWW